MSTNNLSSFLAKLAFFCMSILFASNAYSIEKEDLDVNLNAIYLSAKPHKHANIPDEVVVQIPVILSARTENTGLGSIGSAYYDAKSLIHIKSESAAIRGVGRYYYVASAYEKTRTFVPYVTLYRDFTIKSIVANKYFESGSKSWLSPGFMYAYRKDENVVLHFDAELYSITKPKNNIFRAGVSYLLSSQWIVSGSFERLAWNMEDDIDINNVFMKGHSDSVYLKIMTGKALQDNLSIILGVSADRNVAGPKLQQLSTINNNGVFLGFELSLGSLVW